jgi:hypothetical protein
VLIVTAAWRGDTNAVIGSSIAVLVVMVFLASIHVRITMVGIRSPPGMGLRVVVVVLGEECK